MTYPKTVTICPTDDNLRAQGIENESDADDEESLNGFLLEKGYQACEHVLETAEDEIPKGWELMAGDEDDD